MNNLSDAVIAPAGFREYDARWRYPEQINLAGFEVFGAAIGAQLRARGGPLEIVVGHDYRSYARAALDALIEGLCRSGIVAHDIGMAITPAAYFARAHLGVDAVAMVTASHNPNGWTGVKLGFTPPLTHGPEEMAELRALALGGPLSEHAGGRRVVVEGLAEAYIADVVSEHRLTRPLRVVCATGNGGAGAFAPEVLTRIGADVIPLHTDLDHSFPNYNPNPEALEMLHDIARVVREAGADLGLGFDGDGDRCGVIANDGAEVFADKVGLLLARDLSKDHPNARFIVDVKSTGLFATDPILGCNGAATEYWMTGHSHMKRRLHDTGALAAFEKSGHYFFAPPVGRGYDCAMTAAVAVCQMLDRSGRRTMADLVAGLPQSWTTPTLSAECPDAEKYAVVDRLARRLKAMAASGETLAGRRIAEVVDINGARAVFEDGEWCLVRASSNLPNLVIVCESLASEAALRQVFADFDTFIRTEPSIGAYDQTI